MKNLTIVLAFFLYCMSTFSQNCDEVFTGEGTFYGYGGGGNCSFPAPTSPVYTGAMNELQYDNSMTCGACVEVTGSKGSLVIRIEDRCPECKYGDIDLSEEAFPLIDDIIKGRIPISWKFVPCPVQGAIKLYFKEGSSQWWTAVQVRNHKYPITKMEYKVDDQWVNISRLMYNYFVVEHPGMGPGPYDFRITDMYGHVIEENNIPLIVTTEIDGQNQFPNCDGSTFISVTGVSLSSQSLSIVKGLSAQLTASVLPSNATNKAVSWISNNTTVAAVNSSGFVTAISEGTATITATTVDGSFVDSCIISVIPEQNTIPVTGISIAPTVFTIEVGQSSSLEATITPENATNTNLSWTSDNTSIATVNSNGIVTAINEGTTIITATTNDGNFTASSIVTVTTADIVNCDFGTPLITPLPSISSSFNNIYVIGNGPDLSNVSNFTINWDLASNGLWQLSMNTNNGQPDWWNDLKNNATHSFNSEQPELILSGTGFTGLDGTYYVTIDDGNFVMDETSGAFSIYFSNSDSAPCTELKSTRPISNINGILVYPNPFHSEFLLELNRGTKIQGVKIYNSLGQLMKVKTDFQTDSKVSIEFNGETGLYIMFIETEEENLVKQILKQN